MTGRRDSRFRRNSPDECLCAPLFHFLEFVRIVFSPGPTVQIAKKLKRDLGHCWSYLDMVDTSVSLKSPF